MSKLYKPLLIDSVKAVSNLVKNRFVGFDGDTCGTGEKAYGVCDVETESGQYAPVIVSGIVLLEAGGTVTVGSKVTSDDSGKAVALTEVDPDDDDAEVVIEEVNGYSLDDGTEGDIIRIARGI